MILMFSTLMHLATRVDSRRGTGMSEQAIPVVADETEARLDESRVRRDP